jgi:hypothetical protein
MYESTWNISEEVSKVKVDYDAGNIAVNVSDQIVAEKVDYDSGNIATNISDQVST